MLTGIKKKLYFKLASTSDRDVQFEINYSRSLGPECKVNYWNSLIKIQSIKSFHHKTRPHDMIVGIAQLIVAAFIIANVSTYPKKFNCVGHMFMI